MNFFALDLELNQPSNKIIEVGIAVGNADQGIFLKQNWYLDPEEPIDEYITELTGISDDTIQSNSVPYIQMAAELQAILSEHKCFVNPVQWGAGDGQALRKELILRNIPFQFFGRRDIDVKTIYTYLSIAQGKKITGGLKSCMGRYKLPFEGTPHRAHIDAYNTLKFFFVLIERQATLEKAANLLNSKLRASND